MSFVAPFLCSDLVRVRQSSCKFIINFSKKTFSAFFFLKNVAFYRFFMLYEGSLVQITCFLEFFGCQIALVPPSLSETSDEGFFEKLIDGQLKFLAEVAGWLADVPFVDIDGRDATHFGETDRVEGARNGLLPMETSAAVGGVDGTESACSIVFDESTVLAMNDLGNQFALLIGIDHSFILDLLLSFWRKVIVQHLVSFFKEFHFFQRDGGTCVTFNAAGTMTLF